MAEENLTGPWVVRDAKALIALGLSILALAPGACGGKSARSHRVSETGAAGSEVNSEGTGGSAGAENDSSVGGARSKASGGQTTGGGPSGGGRAVGQDGGASSGGRAATGGQPAAGGRMRDAGVAGADAGGAAGAAGATEVIRDAEAMELLEELQSRAAAAGATSEPWGELSIEDGPLVSGFGCPGMPLSEAEQEMIERVGGCSPILGPPPYESSSYLLIEASAAMLEPWGTSSRWQFILDAVDDIGEYYWTVTNELVAFPPAGELSCSSGAARTVLVGPYAESDYQFFVLASSALSEWSPHGDSAVLLALADALGDVAASVQGGEPLSM